MRANNRTKKLLADRQSPNLHFISFSVREVIQDVQTMYFPDFDLPVAFYFVTSGSLACCSEDRNSKVFSIYAHEVLNHRDTPREVIALICKHELTRHLIPPRKIGKKMVDHPPEFWEYEKQIAPERGNVWMWVHVNIGGCIKRRPLLERTDVLKTRPEYWQVDRLSIPESCDLLRGRSAIVANDDYL